MRDVNAKLDWAVKHRDDLMDLLRDYAKPHGGDARPLGIEFDQRIPGRVEARFIAEKPLPIEASLHAADLVHNTRTALDHVLARLKETFGGDVGAGSFPLTRSDADWKGLVYPKPDRDGKRRTGPLDGLPTKVRLALYREQPFKRFPGHPGADPMAILNKLDNDDKHRLLRPTFAYPAAERAVDVIEVRDPKMIISEQNIWVAGNELEHGTVMARYRHRGRATSLFRVHPAAEIRFSTGPIDGARTTYEAMIDRVHNTARMGAALIDTL
jgi:hypothetical protein